MLSSPVNVVINHFMSILNNQGKMISFLHKENLWRKNNFDVAFSSYQPLLNGEFKLSVGLDYVRKIKIIDPFVSYLQKDEIYV